MNLTCLVPINTNTGAYSVTLHAPDGSFRLQYLLSDPLEIVKYTKEDQQLVCYESMNLLDNFDLSSFFDIKILYELKGFSFRSLVDLSIQVLAEAAANSYSQLSEELKAHRTSYRIAKIDISTYRDDELYPESLLADFYRERSNLIVRLFHNLSSCDLDFYSNRFMKVVKCLHRLSKNTLNIDLQSIEDDSTHYAMTIRKEAPGGNLRLKYNPVGAKTGRLGFKKGTVNIYTLPSDIRKCVVAPQGFSLVQFDFKSFQPRLAIFSTLDEQFKKKFVDTEDIYSRFTGDREKNKINFLSWMFSCSRDENFSQEAAPVRELRDHIYKQAKAQGYLENCFGRRLPFNAQRPNVLFQNYVTSLEVDTVLEVVLWIEKAIKNLRTKILFPYHDAIICQVHEDEQFMILKIKEFMENWPKKTFGTTFPVEVKVGTNFGSLSEYEQK